MNKKNKIRIYLLVMGFVLILSNSCKKDDDNIGIIIDIDGNVYSTVSIGTQTWMKENLKVTHYADRTAIPLVTDDAKWADLTTGAYSWYNNNETTYKATYGALYNYYSVSTGRLCPTGWHVPSDEEWTTLIDYLGGFTVVGGKLKETDTIHWQSPNTGATNETGFTALPGGYRGWLDGSFGDIGNYGFWWSSTEYYTNSAWNRHMYYNDSIVSRYYNNNKIGFSVRCLRD